MAKVRSKQQLSKEIDEIKRKCCCAGGSFEDITYVEALSLVESETLVPGTLYRISGVHKNKEGVTIPVLYDDGNNSGTTIYLTALTTSEFSTEGWGEFYNPRYDQGTYGAVDGTGVYLYNIWDGDNPDAGVAPSYDADRKIIWGGYVWTNLLGDIGSAVSVVELDSDNWTKVAYNTTDYAFVIDYIEYDWANDWILRRRQAEPVIDVIFPYQYWNSVENTYGVVLHGIAVMQWGNNYKAATELGIGLIEVKDAYAELVNFKGKLFLGLSLSEYSVKKGEYYGINTEFRSIRLIGKSYQTNNTFDTGAKQTNILLADESWQDLIEILNGSYQENVRLTHESWQNGQDSMLLDNGSFQSGVSLDNGSYQQGIYDNASTEVSVFYTNGSYSSYSLDNSTIIQCVFNNGSTPSWGLTNTNKSNLVFNGIGNQSVDATEFDELNSEYNAQYCDFYFKVTFDGSANSGAVGAVVIPVYPIQFRWYIEEVTISNIGLTAGVGSYITLGISTDDIDSGLNSTSGLVATIDNSTIKYDNLVNTLASNERTLVMAVAVNPITAGELSVYVRIRKGIV